MSRRHDGQKQIYVVILATLFMWASSACPAPVPEHVGCSSDDDCRQGRSCDQSSGLCVQLDAGEPGDASELADLAVDQDVAAHDVAPGDDAATDDAAINDAAGIQDATATDLEAVDSEGFDATERDAAQLDSAVSDSAQVADVEQPDTELPDTAQPDIGPDPHADAGPDQQVDINAIVMLNANDSLLPAAAQNVTYHWAFVQKPEGSAVNLAGVDNQSAAFTADDVHGVYVIELTVSVDNNELPRDQVRVTVNNRDPQADAGDDVAMYNGSTVQLDASSSSDPDADSLSYSWTLADDSLGQFDDASSASPEFIPAATTEGEVVVTLTVSDGYGGESSDTLVVTVSYNLPPIIADMTDLQAGHSCASAVCEAQFSLSAQVTEPEEENFDLQWSLLSCPGGAVDTNGDCPSGVAADFDDDTAAQTALSLSGVQANFAIGDYVLRLTATDSFGNSSHKDLKLTVSNQGPTGNDSSASAVHTYVSGQYSCEVSFAVDASDPDGDLINVTSLIVSPAGTVNSNGGLNATFHISSGNPTASFLGPYTVTATVEDAFGDSRNVEVNVSCTNSAPQVTGTASSPVNVNHAYSGGAYTASYSLAGSVSDPENDPVACTWSVPHPVSGVTYGTLPKTIYAAAGSVALSNSISSSSTALIASHGIRLNCADFAAGVNKDMSVVVGNRAPTPVSAGADFTVHHTYSSTQYHATLNISASASDPDGDPLSYAWSEAVIGDALRSAQSSGTNTLTANYSYAGNSHVVGARNYTLTATDSSGASASDTVKVTVDNRSPTVSAGGDISSVNHYYASSAYKADINLNSRGSKSSKSDADGDPLSCAWSKVSPASGVTYSFDPTAANPSVGLSGNTNVVRTHTLRYTCSDAWGSVSDDMSYTVINRKPVADDSGVLDPIENHLDEECSCDPNVTSSPCETKKGISPAEHESQFSRSFRDLDNDPLQADFSPSITGENGVTGGKLVHGAGVVTVNATIKLVPIGYLCGSNPYWNCYFYKMTRRQTTLVPARYAYYETVTAHVQVSDGIDSVEFSNTGKFWTPTLKDCHTY